MSSFHINVECLVRVHIYLMPSSDHKRYLFVDFFHVTVLRSTSQVLHLKFINQCLLIFPGISVITAAFIGGFSSTVLLVMYNYLGQLLQDNFHISQSRFFPLWHWINLLNVLNSQESTNRNLKVHVKFHWLMQTPCDWISSLLTDQLFISLRLRTIW